MPKIIGITGGICAGKSLICQIFKHLNIPVYYADQRAKKLIVNDLELKNKIINLLGEESYREDRTYNNQFVAKQVFGNPELLKSLNEIVHPAVKLDGDLWQKDYQNAPFLLYEAALLRGNDDRFDKIILVSADQETRMKRALKRDPQRNVQQIQAIFNAQLSDDIWEKEVDYVIQNNDTDPILTQVLFLYNELTKNPASN